MCLPFFDELNAGFPTLRPSEFSEGHSPCRCLFATSGQNKSFEVPLIGVSSGQVGLGQRRARRKRLREVHSELLVDILAALIASTDLLAILTTHVDARRSLARGADDRDVGNVNGCFHLGDAT